MIPDWLTNQVWVSNLLRTRHPEIAAALEQLLRQHGVGFGVIEGTADIWCKDYAPIQVDLTKFRQFIYRPGYLNGYEERLTRGEICKLKFMLDYAHVPLVLDGGNVVASKNRVILTEQVYRENPGLTKEQIHARLTEIFEAECIFIPRPPYDPIAHADGVVRFLQENLVLVSDFSGVEPTYAHRLETVLRRHRLAFEYFPYEIHGKGTDGVPSAVGCHVNFLAVEKLILLPTFGVSTDDAAVQVLARHAPAGTQVVPMRCENLAREGGVLNCVSYAVRRTESSTKGKSNGARRPDRNEPPGFTHGPG